MKRIKRFNESVNNPLNYLKEEIIDILQDSFLDNGIPVNVKFHDARIINNGYDTSFNITNREYISIEIGDNRVNLPRNEYFTLNDKWEDIKQLFNWSKTENLILKSFNIYNIISSENGSNYVSRTTSKMENVDINKWTGSGFTPGYTEKYGYMIIYFENMGWQTSHEFRYGTSINNQIVQEYEFKDMNQMTNFISESMKVFETQNHHPHYFHWRGSKLLISLKTHSSDSVTQKDWDVASQLDNLI